MLKNKKKQLFLIAFIFSIGIIFSLIELKKPMIAEADAYSRVNIATLNLDNNIFFTRGGGPWLPLHFTLFTTSIALLGNPQLTPRVITLIFSLLSVIIMYFYTASLYKNKKTALLASFVYLVLPIRIFLSTQTLSEPIFIFFILASIVLIQGKKISYTKLITSLLLLNFAHGIRYESWFVLPLLWFFICSKKISVYKKAWYIFSSMLFPLFWIYDSGTYGPGFFSFFQYKYEIAQKQIPDHYFNLMLSYSNWEKKLFFTISPFFIFIGLSEFKKIIKKNDYSILFFYSLFPFFFIALVAQAYLGTMEWFPTRYLLIPITFIVPMIANATLNLFQFFRKKTTPTKKITLVSLVITISFLSLIYVQTFKQTELELQDYSFLSDQKTIDTSEKYTQFLELVTVCKDICHDPLFVFINDFNESYLEHPIIYYSGKIGHEVYKKSINSYIREGYNIPFIWEKGISDEGMIDESDVINQFSILYENDNFYILKK